MSQNPNHMMSWSSSPVMDEQQHAEKNVDIHAQISERHTENKSVTKEIRIALCLYIKWAKQHYKD